MLYIAIGILGATVMPHNLYLHSAIVQTRAIGDTPTLKREAIRFATLDSTLALTFALFVNAAILIMSAAVFHRHGMNDVVQIQDAHRLLSAAFGRLASTMIRPRPRPPRLRPEFDRDGDARRAGRDGGIPEHPPETLAQATRHPPPRFDPRRNGLRPVRHGRHGQAADPLAGDLKPATNPFAVIPLVQFTASRKFMVHSPPVPRACALAWFVAAVIIGSKPKAQLADFFRGF